MEITYIYADDDWNLNCSIHNCFMPAKAINKVPGHHASLFYINDFNQNTEEVQKACMQSDLIIIERNLFGNALVFLMHYKIRNKNIAVVFDDGYQLITSDNISYTFWAKSQIVQTNEKGESQMVNVLPTPLDQFKWGISMAKGVICPSRVLCEDWNYLNRTYRTHNFLDAQRYENATPLFPHDPEEVYVGWAGSGSHLSSFTDSGITGALTYIVKKYPQVKILMGGDKRVYDRIHVPEDRKIFSPYVPEEKYSSLIKSLDIGLAPLASVYDERRSWLKPMEFTILKVPWIGSNFLPYEELDEYGTLISNGLNNWKIGLADMIDNLEAKRELANTKAYDFALTQTWDKNVHKILNMYQEIIDSRYQ